MPYYSGDHLVICDRCGFKRLRSTVKLDWQNWLVCYPECYEVRHPQDITPPSRVDRQWVREPRPKQDPTFVEDTQTGMYIEVDAEGYLTVPSTEAGIFTYQGIERPTTFVYAVHYNQSLTKWNEDWEIQFRVKDSTAADIQGFYRLGVMADIAHSGGGAGTSWSNTWVVGLSIYPVNSQADLALQQWDNGNGNNSSTILTLAGYGDTDVYVKFYMTDNVVYLEAYSDAAMANLIDSQNVARTNSLAGLLQYFLPVCSGVGATGDTKDIILEILSIS